MDDTKLNEYILQRLSEAADIDDVILEVCEKTGTRWAEASRRVRQIQGKSGDEITRRQFPILALLAASLVIAGLALTTLAVKDALGIQDIPTQAKEGPERAIYAIWYLLAFTPSILGEAFLGLAMIFGSFIGLRQAWASVIEGLFPLNNR
jgi:hypothetical protein